MFTCSLGKKNYYSNLTFIFNRQIPGTEEDIIAEAAKNFLNCDLDLVPIEVLINRMTKMLTKLQNTFSNFMKCVGVKNYNRLISCNADLSSKHCGISFGLTPGKNQQCHKVFLNQTQGVNPAVVNAVNNYRNCKTQIRSSISKCLQDFKQKCLRSPIRGFKTIRLKTKTLEKILQKVPDVKVIHLLRDPRAVHSSRRRHGRRYPGNLHNNLLETKMHCDNSAENIAKQKNLEPLYPGTFKTMYYVNIASDPKTGAQKFYEYIQHNISSNVLTWLDQNTKKTVKSFTSRNSKAVSTAWKKNMRLPEKASVNKLCSAVLKNANNNPWGK